MQNKIGNITLFDYQKEAIENYKEKSFNLSDTGVGKTVMALGSFIESKCKKLLVICLAPKVVDFAEDGVLMNVDITPLNRGSKKNKELLAESDKVAISFESVWRIPEFLKWVDEDTFIIIDESHKVANTSSKVTKYVMKLSKKAKYTYLCTATPISNGKYEQYYPQLKMLGVYNGTKKEYYNMFVDERMTRMGGSQFMQITGYRNIDLLENMVNQCSVNYKRDKPYLPEDYVYKTKKPAMFNKLKKNRMYKTDNGEVIELDNSSKLFNALRCVSHGFLLGINKQVSKEPFERLQAILETHNNERVVIFYNYNIELEMLKQLLSKLKRPTSEYNGARKDLKEFKGKYNGVVLAHYKSASTGINDFVISNVMVFNSLPLSSIELTQSKGRIDRQGQGKKPMYYFIIPDTPVEKKIFEQITNGKDFTNEMIEDVVK